jgi:hypothetical protein
MLVAPHMLEELKPHKNLQKGLAVAGIVDGKLRVLDSKYRVITSWWDVELRTFQELYALEGNMPDSFPRYMYRHFSNPFQLYALRSWELIHGVTKKNSVWAPDCKAIRLHIFFRNVRTVAVCANTSLSQTNDIDVIHE